MSLGAQQRPAVRCASACSWGRFMPPFSIPLCDRARPAAGDAARPARLRRSWIGEHHSGGFEIIAAPEVFIAAAAERTKHIRLGTGVKSLPYHHPFVVAETMAQLDT